MTSSWFLIHTELRCTVNHTSDLQSHLPVSPVPLIVFDLYPTFLQNMGDMLSVSVNFTIVNAWIDTIHIKPSLEFEAQGNRIFKNKCFIISPFTNFMSVTRKELNSVTNQYGDVKLSLCSLGSSALDGDERIMARALWKAATVRIESEVGWLHVPYWREVLCPCWESEAIFRLPIQ